MFKELYIRLSGDIYDNAIVVLPVTGIIYAELFVDMYVPNAHNCTKMATECP